MNEICTKQFDTQTIVSLHPIGRDQSVLKEQKKECERIGREVEEQRDRLAKLEEQWTEDAGWMGTDTAQVGNGQETGRAK